MFTGRNFEKCWRCPTDRELLLRSKIQYGWSVHTSNLFRKVDAIPPTEVEAILKVIRRANRMEKLEIERVGRMICRLDNMTKNTLGDGRNNCSMCGMEFGFFSSFVLCADCQKAVCEKCKVDTSTDSSDLFVLCKICSENREVWKKSGGWFYGKFPTMSEECQRECVSLSSGASNVMGATWEHRAPDIVRLESYEPPEENHNDHAQYTDWTMDTSTPNLNTLIDGDVDDGHHVELKSFRESFHDLNQSDKQHCLTADGGPGISRQLSTSCPSLTDLQEGQPSSSRFRRTGALKRRKRSAVASAPKGMTLY